MYLFYTPNVLQFFIELHKSKMLIQEIQNKNEITYYVSKSIWYEVVFVIYLQCFDYTESLCRVLNGQ